MAKACSSSGWQATAWARKIDLRALGPPFAMPVQLIQGEQDLVTPAHIGNAYFDGLSAPSKEFVLLPRRTRPRVRR